MGGFASVGPQEVRPSVPYDDSRRALWIARAYYFAFFASLGALFPLFTVYLAESGMSGVQIGLLSSLPPLIALASNPFWGAVADRWQANRLVLAVLAGVAGFSGLGFAVVSTFWSILIVLTVVNFFRAPIGAILDSTTMGFVARYGVSYGQQRAFGSIGWIITSLSVGFLAGTVGIQSIFVIYAVLLGLVCTILSLKLPVQPAARSTGFRAGVGALIRLPSYRALLVTMTLFGAGLSSQANFLSLDILALGGTTVLVGIANSAGAFFELPVMFLGHEWFRRVSERWTIVASNVGFATLWLLMALAQQPIVVAALAAVLGLFFALYWTAVVAYANRSAPPGMSASAQTIAAAAHGGLGWALGSAVSGVLWDSGGGSAVFFAAAVFVSIGGLVFALVTRSKVA